MTSSHKHPDPSRPMKRLEDVAEHAQHLSEHGDMDSFPEEGTDDKVVQTANTETELITEDDAIRATQAVIDAGLSGRGQTGNNIPGGLDDGTDAQAKRGTDWRKISESFNIKE